MIVVKIARKGVGEVQPACKLTFRRAVVSRAIYWKMTLSKQTSSARSLYLPSRGVRLEEAKAGRLGANTGPNTRPLESMYLDSAIDPATHIVQKYQPSVPAN
jgi:hypothetical protein